MQVLADQYKYLKFTSLENTAFWDFYTLSNKNIIDSKYPLIKLNQVITQRKGFITIDDSKIYKRCRVQVHAKGVVLRDEIIGKEIKTKRQQLCKTNDFLVAEIDAKVGGFGIVPEELEDAIVSGHYFLFEIDSNKLLTEFLGIVIKQSHFSKQVKSTGSTNYAAIRPAHVLDYQIPLPSIEEQKEFVNAYNKKIKEAHDLVQQVNDLESEIETYLFNALGIEYKIGKNIKKGLQTIEYAKVEKWSIEDIFKKNSIQSNKYSLKTLNSICTLITDGTHQTPTYYKDGVIFLSATNVTKKVINWDNVKYISRNAHNEYCIRVKPEVDDILLAKNGTTGVGAIVDKDIEFSIYVSLALLKPKKDIVNSTFLLYIINSKIAKLQFNSRLIGIGVPNLHLGEIKEVVIPLPSIEEQNSIVKRISKMIEKINITNSNIDLLQQQAEQDFERAIFN